MTLWFVLGTAAELIKVYPLIRECESRGWQWRVVSTGQSGQNFWMQYDDFELPREKTIVPFPSAKDLRTSAQALVWFLRAIFSLPTQWMARSTVSRQWIVIHGDTLSTLVGATWGFRLGIPVAHVEAGLRSKYWWQPFPEEICRRIVSRMVNLHFAPDEMAMNNLLTSKVNGHVLNSRGNSLMDAVKLVAGEAAPKSMNPPLCVANLHRFENLNSSKRWKVIVETLLKIAKTHSVVMVMHPQTEHRLSVDVESKNRLIGAGVKLEQRMTFSHFIQLIHECHFLISDGGSNQEESFYLGKPCLLMRSTTERQEGLGQTAFLSHFDNNKIDSFLNDIDHFSRASLKVTDSPTQTMMNSLKDESHV